jgi:uncharacterized membrane protein
VTGLATALVGAAAVGSGVMAGALGAFSGFVMRALAQLPDVGGAAAMQSINTTAVRPPLMVALFGTSAASAGAAIVVLLDPPTAAAAVLTVAGSSLYLAGVVGVTALANVPLNERLAAQQPGTSAADRFWVEYRRRWTRWNHVRSVAALAAATAYVAALASA